MEYLQVFTATPNEETAERIADDLVARRLAAAAQVLGPIASRYWWQGRIERAREWLVIARTTGQRYPAVEAAIRALHPYQVPQIVAVRIDRGDVAYLDWIASEATGPSGRLPGG